MARKQAIESLNSLPQDITGKNELFGGKFVVFGGDFRQVLPVIPKGSNEETVTNNLLTSQIWPNLEKIRLTENMHAIKYPTFTGYLL